MWLGVLTAPQIENKELVGVKSGWVDVLSFHASAVEMSAAVIHCAGNELSTFETCGHAMTSSHKSKTNTGICSGVRQ